MQIGEVGESRGKSKTPKKTCDRADYEIKIETHNSVDQVENGNGGEGFS